MTYSMRSHDRPYRAVPPRAQPLIRVDPGAASSPPTIKAYSEGMMRARFAHGPSAD